MGVPIISTLERQNGANFPLVKAEDVLGAICVVPDIAARDAIPTNILRIGAAVRIGSSSVCYEWNGAAWILSSFFGGGGGGSVDWKDSVKAATTTALAASTRVANTRTANANGAFPTIDGVSSFSVGDRILDKDNATGADRGLWAIVSLGSVSTPWVLARTSDADADSDVTGGMRVPVVSGTDNGGKIFKLDTVDPITVNTTSLSFSLDSGGGSVTAADTTIVVSGSSVKRAPITGDVTIADGSNTAAIAAAAVTTAKLADAGVTPAKLAPNSMPVKFPVRCVATSNVSSLSGLAQTFDGISFSGAGQLVLLTGQTNPVENGLYAVQSGAWTRATEMAAGSEGSGVLVVVQRGNTYANTLWQCTSALSSIVGTDPLTFAEQKASPAITRPVTITPPVATSGSPRALQVTGAAHTTLAASTEAPDLEWLLARTVQFATGALTAQRAAKLHAPTYAFVGASVLSDAATLWISGSPIAGTNATITRSNALWVASGFARFDGGFRAGGQDVATVGQMQTTAAFAWYARNAAGSANSRVVSYGEAATDVTAIGDDTVLIEATEIASGRNVVFLCKKSAGSTADMPSGTGDGVVHLYKAATEPTTGSPANGVEFWSSAAGDLRTKSPGTGFKDLASSGVMHERHFEGTVTTTSTTTTTVLDIDTSGFGADVSGVAEITLTARGVAGTSGVAQRQTCGFSRTGGTLDAPGSLTLNGGAATTGTLTVTNSGANFRIRVTAAAATNRRWDVHVKLMYSNTDAV